MKRLDRSLSSTTKSKIADSMRKYHAGQTEAEKQTTAQKRSESLKRYWQTIPPKRETPTSNNNECSVQDIIL